MAKLFSIIFWLVTAVNFYDNTSPSNIKYLLCLFPNLALQFAIQVMFQYERSDKELDFGKLFSNLFGDSLTLGTVQLFMILWSFAYVPLIWYFEKIMPRQFGISLPFYFIFKPSYWFRNSVRAPKFEELSSDETVNYVNNETKHKDNDCFFENFFPGLRSVVNFTHVNKVSEK
jgi:hypothetical protein